MIDYIGILGFMVILYTVYLIVTEGRNKSSDISNEDINTTEQPTVSTTQTREKREVKNEHKKSVQAHTIEGDSDVLKQGKNYSEQTSNEQPNITPRSQQHFEEPDMADGIPAPSTKNKVEEEPVIETVSVVCPYCDNNVLVPKGGKAECSCCSSILNDKGGVVD